LELLIRVATYIGRILSVISIVYLVIKITQYVDEIPPFQFSVSAVTIVLGTLVFVILCTGLGFYAWTILLRGGDVRLRYVEGYIIVGASQIQKYLPGNLFHYVNRVTLGVSRGVPAEAIIVSTGVETGIAAIGSLIIALTGFAVFGDIGVAGLSGLPAFKGSYLSLVSGVLLLVAIAVIVLFARIRHWLVARLSYLKVRRLAAAMCLYSVINIGIGLFITSLLEILWGVHSRFPWYFFSWGFTIAWLCGFLFPGAPGGIGIREAVMVNLFGPMVGPALALGVAFLLRVITSVSDLITFFLARRFQFQEYPKRANQ